MTEPDPDRTEPGQEPGRARRTPDLPCRQENGELWSSLSPDDLERAKAHCADCVVRRPCLDGALERREPWGVWGGEIFQRGRVVPRKLPRGRPRRIERRDATPCDVG